MDIPAQTPARRFVASASASSASATAPRHDADAGADTGGNTGGDGDGDGGGVTSLTSLWGLPLMRVHPPGGAHPYSLHMHTHVFLRRNSI